MFEISENEKYSCENSEIPKCEPGLGRNFQVIREAQLSGIREEGVGRGLDPPKFDYSRLLLEQGFPGRRHFKGLSHEAEMV